MELRPLYSPCQALRHHAAHASCLAVAIALLAPGIARADAAPPAPPPPAAQPGAADGQIADIIVTARRVRERLQDIPASVAAIPSGEVAKMQSLADIQSLVSGVTFQSYGPVPVVGIRGFGNRSQAGVATTSTVGIFQDGVFVSPPLVSLISAIDTGRIEVAKGPQSTLYGRASYTGAINIVANDPDKTYTGYLEAGFGGSSVVGDRLWSVKGAISLPLTDTLSVRVFGLREKRDGYTYDPVTGNHGGGDDRKIGRVRVLWEPNDTVTARLTGTIMRDDIPPAVVHTGRQIPPGGNNIYYGDPYYPGIATAQQFGQTVWDAIYQTPQSGVTKGESITLDLRIKTPIGELASLSDYQHANQDIKTGIDLTRLDIVQGNTPFDEQRFSQELRLANKIGRFSYLVGAYYLHINAYQGGGKNIDPSAPFATFGPGSTLYDYAGFATLYQPTFTQTNAYAAFAQIGYDFTDKLNLTAGIRQGRDELQGTAGNIFGTVSGFLIPTTPITYRKAAFNATTGGVNLSYKIAPDVKVYGSYTRGNSPGGLNNGGAALINYGEQNVDAFELGMKSQFLDRHLQLNIALFDNQYKNLQITQNTLIDGALTGFITNAGNAYGRGVDMDATAILSKNWRLGVQYTYVRSKITQFNELPAPALQVDFTGAPLVRSPRNSLNTSATYTGEVGPGKLQLNAEEAYSSSYTNDYQGLPASGTTAQILELYRTPGYAVTNLNASYTWKGWQLSAYVRNAFNHQYIVAVIGFDASSYPQEVPGEPRTIGAKLKYTF